MELLKASDLRKIFVKWSHGTLYNRLESLEIKDNPLFTVRNETTGIVQYNHKAIDILKEQYLKEFTSITNDEIDKVIFDYLSSKSNADVTRDKEPKEQRKNLNNDKNDTVDNKELVISLQKQVELLQKQLDFANATNEKLLNTIMFREQKDAYIEKQKLDKLEDVKLIAEPGEDKNQESQEQKKKKKGFFAWCRDFKEYI